MPTTRRSFLQHAAGSAAMFAALPVAFEPISRGAHAATLPQDAMTWDLSWTTKLTAKHKGVFDAAEVESGAGVWRASLWVKQYGDVLKVPPTAMATVLVMRHKAIILAMQQSFWDKYGIGKAKNVTDPLTEQPTDRNPALLSSARNEVPPELDGVALDKYIARGGIALACSLAFDYCVELIKSTDKVGADEAHKQAVGYLVPGVVLQPSGVFAVMRAQEAGCIYMRAS